MSYLAYVVLSFTVILLALILRGQVTHNRLLSLSEALLGRIYMASTSTPRLELGYAYSYPIFKVIFTSKSELYAARNAGLNESFKREIDKLCKGRGSKERPFNVEQGVFFTYVGSLEEITISGQTRSWRLIQS